MFDHGRGFDAIAPYLSERFRLLAVTSRGHGDSAWADAYLWPLDVADLIGVLEWVGRPSHLLGHSRGGGMATDAAIYAPDLVRQLVNLDGFGPPPEGFTAPGPWNDERTVPERFEAFLDTRGRTSAESAWRPRPTLEALVERRGEQNPRLSKPWLRHFVGLGSREVKGGFVWKADPRAGRGAGPFRPDWVARDWPLLKAPMLAIIGREPDTWGPLPEEILDQRLGAIKHVDRASVDGAGHFMHMESPEKTARIILDWLER
jgi:pimeloyl-ACP methyl ester carboxylesterase